MFDKLSKKSIICLGMSLSIMTAFFIIQTMIVFGFLKSGYMYDLFGYMCIILFSPPFFSFVREFLDMVNSNERELLEELTRKNTYLEHAAKILRHDMHSGINTYLPRGVSSLKRRLSDEKIKEFKLEAPLRLINEGLEHSRQVYRGVYEFTNLVRDGESISKELVKLDQALVEYLKRTSYADQVIISDLPEVEVNEPLFCTAVDNLIRNGLKYNDSKTKKVEIYMDEGFLVVQDNGRGISQEEFDELSKPYTRKKNQEEKGTGLGLNICVAIFKEHGIDISVEKLVVGTRIRIGI
jgi:signal transduction histidine kinase